MQYQILVEHPNQNGFVASVIGLPNCVATGSTEEEALARIRQTLHTRLSQAKIVAIEVESPTTQSEENPLLKYAGHLKDDPYFDEVMDEIKKDRRAADAPDEEGYRREENPFSVAALKDDPMFDDFMEKLQQIRREGNTRSFDDEPGTEEAAAG